MTPISGHICCSGAPRPPSRSEAKPVAHPTTINLTASLVVSVTLHASGGCRSKFLRRALTRNCLAALIAGLTQRTPCESSAMPLAGLTQNTSCESFATPLAGLTQNTLPGSRHAPCRASGETLPVANAVSAPEQDLANPLCKALEGNRSNRSENRSVPSRKRGNRTKNPAFGLENRSRLSQRTGRA